MLQESGEMYLETILILSMKSSAVRSVDVAEAMGFSKPSVSRAVGLLKNGGYLQVDEDGLSPPDGGRQRESRKNLRAAPGADVLFCAARGRGKYCGERRLQD